MHDSKLVSTSMPSSTKLLMLDGPFFEDPCIYRGVVGSLQYFTFTQPKISFIVNKACQFMHCHCLSHWQIVKQLLWYLRLTITFVLHFSLVSSSTLTAYADADWVGYPDDRKSFDDFCIFFGSYLIS